MFRLGKIVVLLFLGLLLLMTQQPYILHHASLPRTTQSIPNVQSNYNVKSPHDLAQQLERDLASFPSTNQAALAYHQWIQYKMANLTHQFERYGYTICKSKIENSIVIKKEWKYLRSANITYDLADLERHGYSSCVDDNIYERIVENYAQVFDKLLFTQSLINPHTSESVLLQFRHYPCNSPTYRGCVNGVLGDHLPSSRRYMYVLLANAAAVRQKFGLGYVNLTRRSWTIPEQILGQMLATLLHEMVHAYFILWTTKPLCPSHKSEVVLGETGHGMLFIDVAMAVEKFVEENLGLFLDMEIGNSIIHEQRVQDARETSNGDLSM